MCICCSRCSFNLVTMSYSSARIFSNMAV